MYRGYLQYQQAVKHSLLKITIRLVKMNDLNLFICITHLVSITNSDAMVQDYVLSALTICNDDYVIKNWNSYYIQS